MNTIQPSIDSSSSSFADWLSEAVGLVQRVNARLRKESDPAKAPALCQGRQMLDDQRCLELAGLVFRDHAVDDG